MSLQALGINPRHRVNPGPPKDGYTQLRDKIKMCVAGALDRAAPATAPEHAPDKSFSPYIMRRSSAYILQIICQALFATFTWTAPGITNAAGTAPPDFSLAECHGIRDLAFVAHLDDDLLFMNPDIASNIQAGGCVRIVYLTASERGEGEKYMLGRERGVRAAYAYMARQPDTWTEGTVGVGAYHLARFTLQGNPRIQLLHMRLKDPWLGKGWGSLTPLSRAESVPGATAATLGSYHEVYTRRDLVATIASIIQDYQPTTVRHLDDTIDIPYTQLCWRCTGHGHPDHIASARLVRDALKQAQGNFAETGYVAYPSQERQTNLNVSEIASKSEIFRRYAWNDYRYCSGPQNCQEPAGPAASWVQRSYYVSRRNVAPELFIDKRTGLMLLATGEDNDAVNFWSSQNHKWKTLGGRTAGPLVSFSYPDGSAGVFARDTLGGLWANKQDQGNAWQGWQALAGKRFSRIPAITAHAPLAAVAMGNDGQYYWAEPDGIGGSWTPWQALPRLPHARDNAVIASAANGRLIAFAIDRNGQAWFTLQHAASSNRWSSWQPLDTPVSSGGLAVIRTARNQIVLYLRKRDNNHLLRVPSWIVRAGAEQSGETLRSQPAADMGLAYVGKPALALNAMGDETVALLEQPAGGLWLLEDGKASKLADHAASLPALRFVGDTLYVVARSAGQIQSYEVLSRSKGIWGVVARIAELPAGGGGPFGQIAAAATDALVSAHLPGQAGILP